MTTIFETPPEEHLRLREIVKNITMNREQYHQFAVEGLAITYVRRLGLGGRSKALFPVEIEPRSGRYDNMQEDVEKTLAEVRSLVQEWRS